MPSLSQRSCMASLGVQRQIEAAEGGLADRQGSTEGPSSLDGPRRTNLGELGATRSGALLWARVAPCGGAVRGSRRFGPSSGQHTRPSAWRSTGISRLGLAEGPPPIAQGAGGLLVGWHRPESAGASEIQMREPRRWAGAPVAGARRVVEARCTSASPMKSPLVNGPRGAGREAIARAGTGGRPRPAPDRVGRWSGRSP